MFRRVFHSDVVYYLLDRNSVFQTERGRDATRVLRSILWLPRANGSFPTLTHLFDFMPDLIPEHIWSLLEWLERQGLIFEDTSDPTGTYHATEAGFAWVTRSFEHDEETEQMRIAEAIFNAISTWNLSMQNPDAEMPELLRTPCQLLLQLLDAQGPLHTTSLLVDAVVNVIEDGLLRSMTNERDDVRMLATAAHGLCLDQGWTKAFFPSPESMQLVITVSGRTRLNQWRQD